MSGPQTAGQGRLPRGGAARVAGALLQRGRWRMTATAALALALTGLSRLALVSWSHFGGAQVGPLSWGDGLLWLFMGHPATLDASWAAVWAFVLAASLAGTGRTLRGPGAGALVLAGARRRCWAGLCLAAGARALLAVALLAGGAALWAALTGGPLTLEPCSASELAFSGVAPGVSAADVAAFLAVAALGAVCCGLAQLALGLAAGDVAAFAVTAAVLLGSAFLPDVPLPGSWLMACRVSPLTAADPTLSMALPLGAGAVVFALLGAVAAVAGGACFSRCDLGLGRGQR